MDKRKILSAQCFYILHYIVFPQIIYVCYKSNIICGIKNHRVNYSSKVDSVKSARQIESRIRGQPSLAQRARMHLYIQRIVICWATYAHLASHAAAVERLHEGEEKCKSWPTGHTQDRWSVSQTRPVRSAGRANAAAVKTEKALIELKYRPCNESKYYVLRTARLCAFQRCKLLSQLFSIYSIRYCMCFMSLRSLLVGNKTGSLVWILSNFLINSGASFAIQHITLARELVYMAALETWRSWLIVYMRGNANLIWLKGLNRRSLRQEWNYI